MKLNALPRRRLRETLNVSRDKSDRHHTSTVGQNVHKHLLGRVTYTRGVDTLESVEWRETEIELTKLHSRQLEGGGNWQGGGR